MKANELMIGDWVFDGDEVAKVTSLTCDGIIETTRCISNIEVITPIPLTPEILEKNGFILVDKYDNGSEHWALIDDWDDCDNYWCELFKIANGYVTKSSLYIGFVHQLQHLIKMYGNFEKEIGL